MRFLMMLLVFVLSACSKEPESSVKPQNESIVVQASPSNEFETSKPKAAEEITLTPKQARDFAHNLYKKIEEDELFIRDAAQLGEYDTIQKYILKDWPSYVDIPYDSTKAVAEFGRHYWPNSYQVKPYTICDTAFIGLYQLAGSFGHLIREDTANMRKTIREYESRYKSDKSECKKRIEMSYEEAWKAEEAEWIYAEEATQSELSTGIKE